MVNNPTVAILICYTVVSNNWSNVTAIRRFFKGINSVLVLTIPNYDNYELKASNISSIYHYGQNERKKAPPQKKGD